MSSPVVLITGALTGIGRATALAFAKDGALYANRGQKSSAREDSAAWARRRPGRHRACRRVSRFRKSLIHHRTDTYCRRR
jgi:NAD(P)-dependent dehydrogenase (short-subunit alcohol dehydrogenase family)